LTGDRRSSLRVATLVAGALFMLAGPAYRQVLGGKEEAIRRWTMFHGIGAKLCGVSFHRLFPDGRAEPLDGAAWLGLPPAQLKVKDAKKALRLARELCERLPPGSDLRVDLRCSGPRGWQTRLAREVNACAERS
jgi:hypothetical protein